MKLQTAIAKFGRSSCVKAFHYYALNQYGDGGIAALYNVTRPQANVMIDTGRELAKRKWMEAFPLSEWNSLTTPTDSDLVPSTLRLLDEV